MQRKDFLKKAGFIGLMAGIPPKISLLGKQENMVQKKPENSDNTYLENYESNQIPFKVIDSLPNMPSPYRMKDWKKIAVEQDHFIYNLKIRGKFLPLGWWDDEHINFPIRSFGLPSYVGELREGKLVNGGNRSTYESLPVLGSIIGASLVGIDKSNYHGVDFVTMCKQFYNKSNGSDLILNTVNSKAGNSFWYEIWPGMAFNMLVDLYPHNDDISKIMKLNAGKWIEAINGLSQNKEHPDFNYTSYSFKKNRGIYNGVWHEPDAAAGLAWLEFTAWKKWGENRFLKASKSCMEFLENRPAKKGPYYEIMMPYGAYLAVRMNAELGTAYDEVKMLNWCFDGNNTDRDGWGVTTEKWGGVDAGGLVGQKKYDQYAFAMNTFSQAAALVPIAKYNAVYARSIGKWMLNLTNASRLFYSDEHPKNKQTSALWKEDPESLICYEGVRKNLEHDRFKVFKGILAEEGPYAVGDQVKQFYSFTDICLYGSAWVGMLAAIVDTTNIEGILKIDCNATDFFSDNDLPSYLIYNPYNESKVVEIELGKIPVDIYNRVSKRYIAKSSSDKIEVSVKGLSAMSLVMIPSNSKIVIKDGKLIADNNIVDYYYK